MNQMEQQYKQNKTHLVKGDLCPNCNKAELQGFCERFLTDLLDCSNCGRTFTHSDWLGLINDYPMESTPKSLVISLQYALDTFNNKGQYISHGFRVDWKIIAVYNDVYVLSSEKIGSGGICAGGNFYINKDNLKECVWD